MAWTHVCVVWMRVDFTANIYAYHSAAVVLDVPLDGRAGRQTCRNKNKQVSPGNEQKVLSSQNISRAKWVAGQAAQQQNEIH